MNHLGGWLDALAQSYADEGPDKGQIQSGLLMAERLGERVASVTQRLRS